MSVQENQNSMLLTDDLALKKWKRPVIVELLETNGEGAQKNPNFSETTTGARTLGLPS